MKVIQEGGYKILTPDELLKQQLLTVEIAGRTSYQSFKGEVNEESAVKFVRMLIRRGHESVLEHGAMSVGFYGVSRGFTHELVRHRIAGFTQESTRYVDYAKGGDEPDLERFEMGMIFPNHKDINERVDLGDGRFMTPIEMAEEEERFYRALRKSGWLPEDARQVLPTGLESDIVMTANFREWRHVFELRTDLPAHWEIRGVMGKLLLESQQKVPGMFDDFALVGNDKNGLPYYRKVKI